LKNEVCAGPGPEGVERVHQVWQDRLHAYAAREGFTGATHLEEINEHLDCLVDNRNGFARYKFSGFEIYTTGRRTSF
jgi:hypothetical protein